MTPQLQLLGAPRLAVDGRTVSISWPRRSLSLLAYLFSSRGLVSRDAAAFALWPDDDEEIARGNLRRNLNVLRGALPPEVAAWIVADASSIGFDHAHANTDVAVFEALAENVADHARAVHAYGGNFAAPLYDAWALAERERLRARYHMLLGELIGASFSARRFDAALDYARRIVADEPFREDVVRRIMAIRYAMGDRPGALTEFERFRRALELEMGLEPMPETCGLHDLVLRGESLPFAAEVGGVPRAGRSEKLTSASDALPFGGRSVALERLRAAWIGASAAGGTTVFVCGEAGIGKTRIVSEILERDVGTSARILRGTTASHEARPFEAVLAACAQAAPFIASLDIEPVWLAVLAPLVPEIGARLTDTSVPPPLPPERETLRLFEAFARLFTAVARARPVVAVFEDIHWAGPGTLAAIRHIASRIRGHRILLLATYRNDEGVAVETLRRELCGSRHADSVTLARLADDEALNVLMQLVTPPALDEAQLLVARSEGHPLFLNELIREYPESLSTLASGIAGVVHTRLRRCSSNAGALAKVAAICGSTFDLDLLRAVIGWNDGILIDGIAELLERHFIRATATHERGSYAFTHALVRAAVADCAPPAEQRRIHHIVARALEARSSGATYATEIAIHWQAADEYERSARSYATAARASLGAQARDEAASLALAGEGLTTDEQLRFDLIRIRIEANFRRVPTQSLRADVALLATIAESLDENCRYDAALLAYRIEDVGGNAETRHQTADVLRRFVDDNGPPQRLAKIADVDAANALYRGDFPSAIAAAQLARERYRNLGDVGDDVRATIFIARIHARLGKFNDAFALLDGLEMRVVKLADPSITIDYWYARATAADARLDAPAILLATDRLRGAARDAGDRLMEGHAAWMAGTAHAFAARLTHAFRQTDRAMEIYASLGADSHLRLIMNNRASFLLQVGRFVEATEIFRDNLRYAQDEGILEHEYFSASNLGVALLAGGAAAEAVDVQRRALRLARTIGSDAFEAFVLGDLGAAEATTGAIGEGVEHLVAAAALHKRLNRPSTSAHDLARAARFEPDKKTAARYAREALAILESGPDGNKHAPEILWCCATAFERDGDAAAAAYSRRRGRETLERRLAAIEDAADRRCYREHPAHAGLLALTSGPPQRSQMAR